MLSKNALLLVLLLPALAVAYYFAIALPSNEKAKLQFEKAKYDAEKKEKADSATKMQQADAERKTSLDYCVSQADLNYWNYVKLNGSEVKSKPGTYTASLQVWNTADKRKNDALAECHRQYDK